MAALWRRIFESVPSSVTSSTSKGQPSPSQTTIGDSESNITTTNSTQLVAAETKTQQTETGGGGNDCSLTYENLTSEERQHLLSLIAGVGVAVEASSSSAASTTTNSADDDTKKQEGMIAMMLPELLEITDTVRKDWLGKVDELAEEALRRRLRYLAVVKERKQKTNHYHAGGGENSSRSTKRPREEEEEEEANNSGSGSSPLNVDDDNANEDFSDLQAEGEDDASCLSPASIQTEILPKALAALPTELRAALCLQIHKFFVDKKKRSDVKVSQ